MQDLKDAVRKVALGFSLEEVTEEYGMEDGELKLVKRKETRKEVPPDLKAAKLLLEEQDLTALSDEELERERKRLLKEWKEDHDEQKRKRRTPRGGGAGEKGPAGE